MQGGDGSSSDTAGYTTNLTPTLQLFLDLMQLKRGEDSVLQECFWKDVGLDEAIPDTGQSMGTFF